MEEYYWEYWENKETYSGTVSARDAHVAYSIIRQIIENDFATIQGGNPVGVWAFTEAEAVNTNSNERQFSEEDMTEIISRRSDDKDTIIVERE